eukprot:190660_1
MAQEQEDSNSSLITFGVGWMLLAISLGHSLTIYQIGFVHESGLYIILGLFGGAIWLLFGPSNVTQYNFSPDMFFNVVLPPIIFAAAYNLKRKQFINNFATIMLLAIFGAILNFLMITIVGVLFGPFGLEQSEIMLFAATMSATDGIAVVALIDAELYPQIFGTLIGEGCINDAVAIILYSSIDSLSGSDSSFGFTLNDLESMSIKVLETALISISIGVAVGLISALYFRFVRMQPTPKTELTLVFLFGYLAYSISDLAGQSGIIAVFFCGVCMSHYTFHSLTHESQEASQEAFEAISYSGETFIYISLGFYTFSYTDSSHWSFPFLLTMLSVLVIGRIVVVVVCVFCINVCAKKRLGIRQQLVFWWGGIVRGAICFALSLKTNTAHAPIIVTTTFAICIITTFAVGSLTETFLMCIGMKDAHPASVALKQIRKDTNMKEVSSLKRMIQYVDETYLKPIFGGRKRRVHELSIDNPEFEHHYQAYQNKQIQKAVSGTRLWASAGPGPMTTTPPIPGASLRMPHDGYDAPHSDSTLTTDEDMRSHLIRNQSEVDSSVMFMNAGNHNDKA